jgi:hypothetical protein
MKKASIASILVGSAALAVITGRRPSHAAPTSPFVPPPAPSSLPPVPSVPSVPTEQPKPRATPKQFAFTALHRYEIEADVLPVDGVGLATVASKALAHLRFEDGALKTYKTVQRAGVGEVTRVKFEANSIIHNRIDLDRQYSIAGVGSVWLVAAKEVGP